LSFLFCNQHSQKYVKLPAYKAGLMGHVPVNISRASLIFGELYISAAIMLPFDINY